MYVQRRAIAAPVDRHQSRQGIDCHRPSEQAAADTLFDKAPTVPGPHV